MKPYQRPGIDHDPVVPFVWGDYGLRADPVEIVSYPIPHAAAAGVIDKRATVMVRTTVGDPTTLREVPLMLVACFAADRHEWNMRPRRYYSDNPSVFVFTDKESH